MQIATWNVNSIKAHLDSVLTWLKDAKPDVVCLQETKCEDAVFPTALIEELGYNCALHGQKTYNGVAILSKHPMDIAMRGLPGMEDDQQSRYIEVAVSAATPIVVSSIYLPNGNPAPGPKFDYKLRWINALAERAKALLEREDPVVLLGDYNVIPAANDVKNPQNWTEDALFKPESRHAFAALKSLGFTEAFRSLQPRKQAFSFWDYQAGAWQKNNGIRIDHALLSPQAADMLVDVHIHKDVRGWEKPSDHVPVVVTLNA
jgi:exodeoxyribonuclease III